MVITKKKKEKKQRGTSYIDVCLLSNVYGATVTLTYDIKLASWIETKASNITLGALPWHIS